MPSNRCLMLFVLASLVLPCLSRAVAEGPPESVTLDLEGVPKFKIPLPEKHLHPVHYRGEGRRIGWIVRLPSLRKEVTFEDGPVPAPSVVAGRVFAGGGSQSLRLFALDAMSGKRVYAVDLDEASVSMVASGPERIVTCTESCTTYGVEPTTGKRVWSLWLGPSIQASPTIDGRLAVMGYRRKDNSYALTALDIKDGRVVWDTTIPRDIVGAPVTALGRIFVTTSSRHSVCLDREGTVLWQRDHGATSAPWLGASGLYYAATSRGSTNVIRVNPSDGALMWSTRAPAPSPRTRSTGTDSDAPKVPAANGWGDDPPRPIVLEPHVVLARGRELMVFDADTGEQVRRLLLPEGRAFHAPPAVLGNRLLYATLDGLLLEIDPGSGAIRRALDLGVRVTSQPVIAKGRAYVTAGPYVLCVPWTGPDWPEWGGGPSRTGR